MSTKTKFYVDWSDSAFPQVKPIDAYDYDRFAPEGMTFTQCKAEIREHFQNQIDFARERLSELAALRVADVDNED